MGELLEVTVAEAYQHLVCVGCQGVFDVRPAGVRSLRLPAEEQHGYEILGVTIVFRGRCPRCQHQRRPGDSPPTKLRHQSGRP